MRDYQKLTPPWVICHALYCQNIQDEPKSRGDRSRVVFFKFNNPPETYGFPEWLAPKHYSTHFFGAISQNWIAIIDCCDSYRFWNPALYITAECYFLWEETVSYREKNQPAMCPVKEILVLCALLCFSEAGVVIQKRGHRVVVTKKGGYRGLVVEPPWTAHLTNTEVFYGIKYASLRHGNIRFIPPSSLTYKWQDIRDASTKAGVCPQTLTDVNDLFRRHSFQASSKDQTTQDEDCLFLNVNIPYKGKFWKERVQKYFFFYFKLFHLLK